MKILKNLSLEHTVLAGFAGAIAALLLVAVGQTYAGALLALLAILALSFWRIRRDMHGRRRAEIALQQSESRLNAILDHAPIAIYLKDYDGRYLMINNQGLDNLKRQRDEVLGKTNLELGIPADVAAHVREVELQVLHSGCVVQSQDTVPLPGGVRSFVSLKFPLPGADGQAAGIGGIAYDVTEQQQAVAALVQNEARLRQILDVLPVGVWLADASGRLLSANPAGEKLWAGASTAGIEPHGDFKGWRLASGEPLTAEEWGLARAARDGEVSIGEEIEIQCFDGSRKIILNSAAPLRDAEGRLIGAVAVNQDITALKTLAEELQARNEDIARKNGLLAESNRLKSEFLASMSHELRTPLNAIIGFSEILKDGLLGELTAQQRDYAADIFASGQHLLSLINDILDLSKIEAGKLELELEPLDLASLLSNSLAVVREKAQAHKISLALQIEAPIAPLLADARKTKQIIYNLVANAVKFTPDGGQVTLGVRLVDRRQAASDLPGHTSGRRLPLADGPEQTFIEISVADSGIGISAEGLQQLFQPFVQIDSSLARRYEGTGLGLAMVRRLTELHGGSVAVSSTPGQGSCFTVWLPYRPDAAAARSEAGGAEAAAAPQSAPEPTQARQAPPPGAPVALVIEDDANAAQLLLHLLESEGFRTYRALSAEKGLEMATRLRPALIVLDILLPGMDGWDCLARLKEAPKLAETPVVIVSIVADRGKGLTLGAATVLQKPVGRDELLAAIRRTGAGAGAKGKLRVLIVDDDPKTVELIACFLAESAYTVLRASNGREGITLARQNLPDLLVLDLMMPEVNGFDVVEALRADPATSEIPILILTAKELTQADRSQLDGMVQSILSKADFKREAFLNEVRRAINRPKAAD